MASSLRAWGAALRIWHRHEVHGLEHLRAALASGKPVLMAGNHVLDVSDPLMLTVAIHQELGRVVSAIGHEMLFFQLPGMRSLTRASATIIPSRHPALAERILRREGALLVYPGAGQEAALRSYRREPYTLKWYGRLGFVELALRTGAQVLFVAGVGIDEMYYQTDWQVPHALLGLLGDAYWSEYRGMRVQIGAAGLHLIPGVFPLPVRVTHTISPPLALEAGVDPDDREALERAQVRLWSDCQGFLDQAVAKRDADGDWLDRALRTGMRGLERIGV